MIKLGRLSLGRLPGVSNTKLLISPFVSVHRKPVTESSSHSRRGELISVSWREDKLVSDACQTIAELSILSYANVLLSFKVLPTDFSIYQCILATAITTVVP